MSYAKGSFRDLTPIVVVIGVFQFLVLRQPLEGAIELVAGALAVALGLTLFIYGLELALFPIGESLAIALARKGSALWLVVFAFLLGFGTTIAEPALTAVAAEAARVAADAGAISATDAARDGYTFGLRITVALSVGAALGLGRAAYPFRLVAARDDRFRLRRGHRHDHGCSRRDRGHCYDSGGITTSTVTVPLVAALGVGLASSIKDRNPMLDGFGLIAFASLLPMIFVMVYGGVAGMT